MMFLLMSFLLFRLNAVVGAFAELCVPKQWLQRQLHVPRIDKVARASLRLISGFGAGMLKLCRVARRRRASFQVGFTVL